MPNPWLNDHKSTAAMNYFLTIQRVVFQLFLGQEQIQQYIKSRQERGRDATAFDCHWKNIEIWVETKKCILQRLIRAHSLTKSRKEVFNVLGAWHTLSTLFTTVQHGQPFLTYPKLESSPYLPPGDALSSSEGFYCDSVFSRFFLQFKNNVITSSFSTSQ